MRPTPIVGQRRNGPHLEQNRNRGTARQVWRQTFHHHQAGRPTARRIDLFAFTEMADRVVWSLDNDVSGAVNETTKSLTRRVFARFVCARPVGYLWAHVRRS